MTNHLATALSPYLLQHKDNPVDWWPWCDEAFEQARTRQVPIFLSVGYAACHWCHVMAHESFEDPQVATVLRDGFVAIKVDREERPDIDAVYMQATTAMTGQGGWPMTCLLTPEGRPFFAGTYLPREQLLRLLDAAHTAWTGRRDEIEQSAGSISTQLQELTRPPTGGPLGPDELAQAVTRLLSGYDTTRGGFGGAPKFPPSMVLEFLARHHARTGSPAALRMLAGTCAAMARGGIYDQLAGGFARYSVDAAWVVPHFEKMLYDNALLLRVYAHWWQRSESALARRIALETGEFLLRELRTEQGAFASALDADTAGQEGATYVWTPDQLHAVLGPDDGRRAADLLRVTGAGTFEHGTSTLQLPRDPTPDLPWPRWRDALLRARAGRPQPARDDKVVASWNGLAVAALAEAGALLHRTDWVDAAERCAQFLLREHLRGDRLRRVSRGGVVGDADGASDDYGNLAEGLLMLHQVTGRVDLLHAAERLLETATTMFAAPDGGFYDTADDAVPLILRPRATADNAEPCGTSALAAALLTCSALTGSTGMRRSAERALESMAPVATRDPRFAGWALAVAEAAASGPVQVAVVADGPGTDLEETARRLARPGSVVVRGMPDAPGVPLLTDRPLLDGRATAYVCRGFVCDRPTTDTDQLTGQLTERAGSALG